MAPSFDRAVSSLLCAEDNSVFNFNVYGDYVGEFEEANYNHINHRTHYQNRNFFNGYELQLQTDESIASMVERECHHLPASGYLMRLQTGDLDVGVRNQAVLWIERANAHFSFGPLCAYLSVNYLDRFLSACELPGKAWTMQLLAVACLSLASKIEEIDVPFSQDLQVGDAKILFEAKTIQRMELLVLNTLRWRMQAVTPFSFIDYFLHKINDDQIPPKVSIMQSVQLILSTTRGIEFLAFKPSEIAAAVAISVARETRSVDTTEIAISVLIQNVEKERVLKCIELINEMSLINGSVKNSSDLVQSVPQSPIGVLEAACLSYKSDDTTVGSCANSSQTSPDTKRGKLNRPFEIEL